MCLDVKKLGAKANAAGAFPANLALMDRDAVDDILAQWHALRPELDLRAMGTFGRISRVTGVGARLVEGVLLEHGLALGDFDVLAALRRSGEPHRLTPTQLYRTLMITSGTMTHRLDKLEERGLVVRLDDPSDRRGTLVALTSAGARLVDAAVADHVANETRLLACLSRTERVALDGMLRKMLVSFEGELAARGAREPQRERESGRAETKRARRGPR